MFGIGWNSTLINCALSGPLGGGEAVPPSMMKNATRP